MGRRAYTDDDRAAVWYTLQSNGMNIKRTARDTGVPVQTVRDWRDRWARDGVPPEIQEQAEQVALDFVEKAERVRDKALHNLEQQVDNDALNGRELTTLVGVLTDKINVSKGLATSRSETVQIHTVDRKELQAAFRDFASTMIQAAHQREEDLEIIDAEIVGEQSTKELPAPTEVLTLGD